MQGKNIILVVGAGAVENAWNPVIRAVNRTLNINTDADGANFLFARHIYLFRFYAKVASNGSYKEFLDIMKSNISILKENIANELKSAQKNGEIRPRRNFKEIVEKFVTPDIDKAFLVSANWDEVIDKEINRLYSSNYPRPNSQIECFHIHGSIHSPEELYLPSEITQENYRTWDEESRMGRNHESLMSLLHGANRIVLYGISLDPLDAELNQTLAAGWASPKIEDIIIVNPSHEKVAKRVKLLLDPRYPAKITGYGPNDLGTGIEYV